MQPRSLLAFGLVVSLVALMLAGCSSAAGPSIRVQDAWARPAMAMTGSGEASGTDMSEGQETGRPVPGTGAVFMRLVNEGEEADRLVGGATDVARVVEIHETMMEDDVMTMRMLAEGLQVPAKGEVLLKPGSTHVMLIGLQRDLQVGDTFTLELQFEKSGTVKVSPEVREP